MTTWKETERRIAAALGGGRAPISGRQRGDVPALEHPTLAIEVKHRRDVPRWLTEARAQAAAAPRDGQVPVAVVHRHGGRHAHDLVVVRLADVRAHCGDAPGGGEETD